MYNLVYFKFGSCFGCVRVGFFLESMARVFPNNQMLNNKLTSFRMLRTINIDSKMFRRQMVRTCQPPTV
ncbi:hypothetical protein HYQ44_019125 [Verticillium longisporum]|nr:hypothetical protein HYQ44_019125 [Verticillium longisporum]